MWQKNTNQFSKTAHEDKLTVRKASQKRTLNYKTAFNVLIWRFHACKKLKAVARKGRSLENHNKLRASS